jgi:hypothetical protein
MPSLFVLDVPEFAPLLKGAEKTYRVSRKGGYAAIAAPDELVIERAASGLGDAIWYGALTGGYEGRVREFSAHRLRIAKE